MSQLIEQLQEQKNTLTTQIQELGDNEANWTPEDEQRWDSINDEYNQVVEQMQSEQRSIEVAARMEAIRQRDEEVTASRRTEIGESRANRNGEVTEEHRSLAMQAWLRHQNGLELEGRHEEACHLTSLAYQAKHIDVNRRNASQPRGYRCWNQGGRVLMDGFNEAQEESRALSVGTDSAGGYTAPEGFSNELDRQMLAFGGPRQVCQIMTTTTGNDLPWPTVNDTSNTGELLAENGSIGSSTDPTFGVVTFNAYKYSSKPILVSAELLEDSAFNLGQVLASLLGERLGRITATHFTTGTGSSQPNGLATAASAGVTAASATAITADELIDMVHAVDPAYRTGDSVGWMFEDATLKAIRKLKDGDSQYLWQPGMRGGEPDLLFGYPYTINQDVASIATGNITVLFGDFSKYVIRDVAQMRLHRLEERYRDNDQTGFVAFSRHDGDLLQSAAIKKLTQA